MKITITELLKELQATDSLTKRMGIMQRYLETNTALVFSYIKAYCGEYGIKQMIQLHKLEQKEK